MSVLHEDNDRTVIIDNLSSIEKFFKFGHYTILLCIIYAGIIFNTSTFFSSQEKVYISQHKGYVLFEFVFGSIGIFIGSVCSDKFGRKKATIASFTTANIIGLSYLILPDFSFLYYIRLVQFLFIGMSFSIVSVFVLEQVSNKDRYWILSVFCWPAAMIVDRIVTIITRKWIIVGTLNFVVFLIVMYLIYKVQESPRWLLSHGYMKEGKECLKQISLMNSHDHLNDADINDAIFDEYRNIYQYNQERRQFSLCSLFFSKKYLPYIFIMASISIINNIIRYGAFTYMLIHEVDGIKMIFAFTGDVLVYFPILGNALVEYKYKNVGRKTIFQGSIIFLIVSYVLTNTGRVLGLFSTIIPYGTMIHVLLFATSSQMLIVIHMIIIELFPTPIRNRAYGMNDLVAGIGTMIGIGVTGLYKEESSILFVPFLIAIVIFTGIFSFVIPETKNQDLRDCLPRERMDHLDVEMLQGDNNYFEL
uniref:MFS domain-containing protein n=1 Tax=Parastrongyloides trichosuri TaxID=131310 RepID=A0A0N4ZCZ9_PARTI